MCLETASRRIAGLVAAYQDPVRPAWGRARLYAGVSGSDDIAGQALQHFATRKIKEQQEAQSVLSFGATRTAGGGGFEGGEDGDGGKGKRPPKQGPKGGGRGGADASLGKGQ